MHSVLYFHDYLDEGENRMKKIGMLVLAAFVVHMLASCISSPEYKPTKESSSNYDIIDEDEK